MTLFVWCTRCTHSLTKHGGKHGRHCEAEGCNCPYWTARFEDSPNFETIKAARTEEA